MSCFCFLFHNFQEEGKSRESTRETHKNVQMWKSQRCTHWAVSGAGQGASVCVSVFWAREKGAGGTYGSLGKRNVEIPLSSLN